MRPLPFLDKRLVAYDTETHLIQPGLLAPNLVCGSVATEEPNSERALSKDDARRVFRSILEDTNAVIGGANLSYDFGVHAADDPSLVDLLFQVLEDGRAVDTHILEPLHDNAHGLMFIDPRTQQEFKRYSLAMLEERYFGTDRSVEKQNGWRLKYATLDGVPLDQWPQEAIDYPRRDARGTFDVLRVQLGPDRQNLQCVVPEMRAAFFLHLACLWGMRTDPGMVEAVVGDIIRKHEESRKRFFAEGIVRVRPCNKKKDKATGISKYEDGDDISVQWLDEARAGLVCRVEIAPWVEARIKDIESCRKALAVGRPIRFAQDSGRLKELVNAAYRGDPPMTSGGESSEPGISTSRDTLVESGDELLEEYGEAGPNEKLFSTYVKVLTQGTRVPINPSANSIVVTQRTSYREPNLQQLPRRGGIRECFTPRGYEEVECE